MLKFIIAAGNDKPFNMFDILHPEIASVIGEHLPATGQPAFIRTERGVLGYTLADGLDGNEHVLTWVTNDERLTGERLCNHVVHRDAILTVLTSDKRDVPFITDDEDDEL